jgi:zinc/manganese transport system substrate-binding protein
MLISWLTRRGARVAVTFASAVLAAVALAACGVSTASVGHGSIRVVAAENEYGNVASQIGGRYVTVQSVESNPNTDPHSYEVSPGVAQEVSSADLLIENGVGYDEFMARIAAASPNASRRLIDVQQLLGLPDSTPNPHLWYSPGTMPKVAITIATDLSRLEPAHAAYFAGNAARFTASLKPWLAAIAQFKTQYPGTPVASTEPVADYMLEATGTVNRTPFSFQADIMNGTDPSPQGVSHQQNLFSRHLVKVFVYNEQVTDSLTQSFITEAKQAGVPIVGVYETMPTPGYTYQSWMLAEVKALRRAVADKVSTEKLS